MCGGVSSLSRNQQTLFTFYKLTNALKRCKFECRGAARGVRRRGPPQAALAVGRKLQNNVHVQIHLSVHACLRTRTRRPTVKITGHTVRVFVLPLKRTVLHGNCQLKYTVFSCITLRKITNLNENYRQNSQ